MFSQFVGKLWIAEKYSRKIRNLHVQYCTSCSICFHIYRTFGASCDTVKSKLKSQISAWTTADNCKNGGEKCLYKVRMTITTCLRVILFCFLQAVCSFYRVISKSMWSKWFSGHRHQASNQKGDRWLKPRCGDLMLRLCP